jgi:hypothetical protein
VRRKLDVLARHCEEVGRDQNAIEKTISTRLAPGEGAEQFAERCAPLSALGIDHAVTLTTGPWTSAEIDVLGAAARLLAAGARP